MSDTRDYNAGVTSPTNNTTTRVTFGLPNAPIQGSIHLEQLEPVIDNVDSEDSLDLDISQHSVTWRH